MQTLRNERGLTLLEVVVSMVILMLLILGVGAMLTTTIRADTYTQERHIAGVLAQMIQERCIRSAAMGTVSFEQLQENDFPGAIPAKPAIPGVRPAIPAEPSGDRLFNDFDWDDDGTPDFGPGSKNIYVYQLLVKDIWVVDGVCLLKQINVRIYYANQTAAEPRVDLARHPSPGGPRPRRYGSPLAEVCTYINRP
jgi:type II secretory pathway pseudopilin PulG